MKLLIRIITICLASTACQEEGEMKLVDEPIAETEFVRVSTGSFVDLNTGHALTGNASFFAKQDGEQLVRFEDFSVVNGPDVNVYISRTSEFKDVIDLGDLKASQGNINYAIDPSIDTKEYRYVLIWCVKYAVLFGYAEVK